TLALFLVGQLLQQFLNPVRTGVDAPEPGQITTLAGVLVAGLAACLVNPHGYHAFALPATLSFSVPADVLSKDTLLSTLYLSSVDEYLRPSSARLSAIGPAYLLLLFLSMA